MVVAEAMGRAGGGTPNRVRVSGFGAAVGGGGTLASFSEI
jgi:hypothetical protein